MYLNLPAYTASKPGYMYKGTSTLRKVKTPSWSYHRPTILACQAPFDRALGALTHPPKVRARIRSAPPSGFEPDLGGCTDEGGCRPACRCCANFKIKLRVVRYCFHFSSSALRKRQFLEITHYHLICIQFGATGKTMPRQCRVARQSMSCSTAEPKMLARRCRA